MKRLPGLLKKLFQRVVMVSVSIVAQLVVFVLMIWKFQDQNEILYILLMVLSVVVTLAIISKNTPNLSHSRNSSFKNFSSLFNLYHQSPHK